ncbi:MAG: ion channel [Rhizomicrobium sp.]
MSTPLDPKRPPPSPAFRTGAFRPRERLAIVKGQDTGRYTDLYHIVLRAPWWLFFLGLAGVFVAVNAVFALAYVIDRGGIDHARPGNFWDAFIFSAQTIGSINYSVMVPKSAYVNILVIVEAFTGYIVLALFTGMIFARFSRPFARVIFSKVAVISPFDGVPTLMFRTANQRGNQVLDATVTVTLAAPAREQRGHRHAAVRGAEPGPRAHIAVRAFLDHHASYRSEQPLYGVSENDMVDKQMEVVALLSGADATMAETIYARYSYGPDDIVRGHRFVDVLSLSPRGQRVVDLNRFHDTCPI